MASVKLSDMMKKRQLLSFELFPPKTDRGMANLSETIQQLCRYKPEYISVTYGAGGGNVGANREVCRMVRNAGTVPVTHFTVIRNTKQGIREQLETYLKEGVDHILALRGDFPRGETSTGGDFNYATDLVKFIRDEFGEQFEIAVAGSPEGHISCRSLEADIGVLKMKQDNGADYIMTQLCWDMEQFERWLDKIRRAGVTLPVDVGIMPIQAPFDDSLEQKKADFKKAGIEYTIRQIDKYRSLGVEGIHLYAMNKWKDVSQIIERSGIRTLI